MDTKIKRTLNLTQNQWWLILRATLKYTSYDENQYKKLVDVINDDTQSVAKRDYAKKRAKYWNEIREILNELDPTLFL